MWTKLRNVLIGLGSIALLLFAMGFAVATKASLPTYALVFLNDADETYLAPQCINAWRHRGGGGALRRAVAGDAARLDYAPDPACAKSGAFAPEGASISRLSLEKLGLMATQKQWWDAPYRTEDGMVYPPATHV